MADNPLKVLNKVPKKYRTTVVIAGAGGLAYVAYRRKQAADAVAMDTSETNSEVDPNGGAYQSGSSGVGNGYAPIVVSGQNGAADTANNEAAFSFMGRLADSYFAGNSAVVDKFSGWADNLLNVNFAKDDAFITLATAGTKMPEPATIIVNPIVVPAQPTDPPPAPTPVYVPTPAPVYVPTPAPAPEPAFDPTYGGKYTHRNKATGQYYRITVTGSGKNAITNHVYGPPGNERVVFDHKG